MGIHGVRAKQLASADLVVAHVGRATLRVGGGRASRHQYHHPRRQHLALVLAAAPDDGPKLVQRRRGCHVCRAPHACRVGCLGRRTEGRAEHVLRASDAAGLRALRSQGRSGQRLPRRARSTVGVHMVVDGAVLCERRGRSSGKLQLHAVVDVRSDLRRRCRLRGGDRPLQLVALLRGLRALCRRSSGEADVGDAALRLPALGFLAATPFPGCESRRTTANRPARAAGSRAA